MPDNAPEESWTAWLREHGPRLLLVARQWTRSTADAEDVVQEAFVRYWRRQRALPGSAFALLATSIRRAACDLARQRSRREAREWVVAGDPGREPFFEPDAADPGRTAAIEQALRRLPAEQREVLVLKIWQDLTFEEIARVSGCPANTAASRYRYALAALRKELAPTSHHV